MEQPKQGKSKIIKAKDGGRSVQTTTTTTVPGTKDTVIKGSPGTAAVLATTGAKGGPEFNKSFAAAKKSGKNVFSFKGKLYKTSLGGTPGKPGTPATPDKIIPGTPPQTKTEVDEKPIASTVYKINALRGTIGGKKRAGVGGAITTDNQVTSNKDVAERAIKAQENYNDYVGDKYAKDTTNSRGLSEAQLALRNKKIADRNRDLKSTASASEIEVQSGLERKKVKELRAGK